MGTFTDLMSERMLCCHWRSRMRKSFRLKSETAPEGKNPAGCPLRRSSERFTDTIDICQRRVFFIGCRYNRYKIFLQCFDVSDQLVDHEPVIGANMRHEVDGYYSVQTTVRMIGYRDKGVLGELIQPFSVADNVMHAQIIQ